MKKFFHVSNPTFNIRPEWMARVREVVQWAYDLGIHVMLNTHHENGLIGQYRLSNATIDRDIE